MIDNEKIVNVAVELKDKLIQLNINETLIAEIEWCLGSFANDGNPEGLILKGKEAVNSLKKFKESNPRKVSKKLIEKASKILS